MNETFNIKEASQFLKCSESMIRKMVKNKSIPFFRVGNRLFFRKESIELWIKNMEFQNIQDNNYEAKIKPLNRGVI